MQTQLSKTGDAHPRSLWLLLVRRAWWKGGGNWLVANARSIKAVTWTLYQYLYGWGKEPRPWQKRTKARWLWCEEKWITCERWTAPRFDAAVCNGHGEHYGYPRHHAYLLLWRKRHGYAFGVEFSAPNTSVSGPCPPDAAQLQHKLSGG